jgi:hypothetical protein
MNNLHKYLFFILLIASSKNYTQDTSLVSFFPLNIGNIWVYNGSTVIGGMGCINTYIQKIYIDSSRMYMGKKYFKFNVNTLFTGGQGTCSNTFISNGLYYRLDTLSGNVYTYDSTFNSCLAHPYEKLVDSLNSKPFDTTFDCSNIQYLPVKQMFDTSLYVFGSTSYSSKTFGNPGALDFFRSNTYAKHLGYVNYRQSGPGIYSMTSLKGCVINGNLIGDTSLSAIGLNQISSEIPLEFSLSQNYPNPFNPTTQIGFDIPKASFVNLVVYDGLGREIEKLVNQQLSPGSYKYEWDASSYPSGIYFYKLKAGDPSTTFSLIETKKMVLIK